MVRRQLAIAVLLASAAAPSFAANPAPVFAISDAVCVEGEGCVFTITKSAKARSYSQIQFGVADDTAKAGTDYVATGGILLTFGNNELVKRITVRTIDNEAVDGPRKFVGRIAPVRFSAIGRSPAAGAISDNDVAPPPQVPTQTCPDGSIVPAAEMCPMPPTPPQEPGGWVAALTPAQEIASNFDIALGKTAAALPPTNAPDVVGAFRFICAPGQILADDPIVYPNQPGRSHLHQFYGNTGANAHSTYALLRTTGKSTCSGPDNPLNRSAYWMPALLDGKGHVLRPNYVTVYYKRSPQGSAQCTNPALSTGCVEIPTGLDMIAGRDLYDLTKPPNRTFHFSCTKPSGATAGTGSYWTMAEALAVCPAGEGWQLTFTLDFPECWDSKNLDSPDHRSHVAYPKFVAEGLACPATHPKFMPAFKLSASYSVVAGDDVKLWRLSSDAMAPDEPAGSTLHGDYKEAWDPPTKREWTANCLDKLLSCAGGNLGDGFMVRGAQIPSWGFGTIPDREVLLTDIPVTP